MEKFDFFDELEIDCAWNIVKNLKKIAYDKGNVIYHDQELSDTMFFIHKGIVKLYADNDFPFVTYEEGRVFGFTDLICGLRRNGTARAMSDCLFYKIQKYKLEEIFEDFKPLKRKIMEYSLAENKEMIVRRLEVQTTHKEPAYGFKHK